MKHRLQEVTERILEFVGAEGDAAGRMEVSEDIDEVSLYWRAWLLADDRAVQEQSRRKGAWMLAECHPNAMSPSLRIAPA